MPGRLFALALLAGSLAVAALAGLWIVNATIVRMPGNVLPDMSGYPALTVVLVVGMGSWFRPCWNKPASGGMLRPFSNESSVV